MDESSSEPCAWFVIECLNNLKLRHNTWNRAEFYRFVRRFQFDADHPERLKLDEAKDPKHVADVCVDLLREVGPRCFNKTWRKEDPIYDLQRSPRRYVTQLF